MRKRRALVGTREGYARCARCSHARLVHAEHGAGPCSRSSMTHETDERGRNVARFAHCICPRFLTESELT